MGYDDAIDYLYGLRHHGIKLGLDNTRRLLAELGEPQREFRSVHVAGTNGKGSTAAMLASMLGASGLGVGLFTSPHLVSFTERIRVDGEEIAAGEVVSLTSEVREAAGRAGLNPTFFEAVTAMGFLYFMRRDVRWAVVEAGMGGRLDATNVLLPEVSIITPIGMDHAEFLGKSLVEIAREKAGIIKEGVPVVSAPQGPPGREVISRRAGELHLGGRDFDHTIKDRGQGRVCLDYSSGDLQLKGLEVPLSGPCQALNASLAVKAFQLLSVPGLSRQELEAAVREGLSSLRWPGRLELLSEAPRVLIDGAHNPDAAEALARTLKEDYLQGGEKLALVIGVMEDKDIEGILRPLLPLAEEIIFTSPETGGRSAPPAMLVEHALRLGFQSSASVPVGEAVRRASASGRTVLVTGSFYVTGAAKEALGSASGFGIGLRE
jgi:dihydrofolate synthase/folylpolyglutamate synthase